jgi:hypothetical protein
MDDMREIVTVDQVDRLFIGLALAAPLAGLLVRSLVRRLGGRRREGALVGWLIALLGPLNLILWHVYNAITNHLGLDTVKNLLVNLALFLALGCAAGLALGYWIPPDESARAGSLAEPGPPAPAESAEGTDPSAEPAAAGPEEGRS